MLFIHVAWLRMRVLFYFYVFCLHVCAFAFKSKVHCGSALGPGASGLPYNCTPRVCVPAVIGALAVCQWQQNTPKKNRKANTLITHILVDFEKILAAQHVSNDNWPLCERSHGRSRMMDKILTVCYPTVALHGRYDHNNVSTLFHDCSFCTIYPAVPLWMTNEFRAAELR